MALKVRNGSGGWDVIAQANVRTPSGWTSAKKFVYNGASWVQVHPGVQLQSYGPANTIEIITSDIPVPPAGSVTSEISFNNSGNALYRRTTWNAGTTNLSSYNWLLPNNTASDYYAIFQVSSGSVSGTSSPVNSLVWLGGGASWSVVANGVNPGECQNVSSCSGVLSITNSYGTAIVSINVSLSAEAINDTVC